MRQILTISWFRVFLFSGLFLASVSGSDGQSRTSVSGMSGGWEALSSVDELDSTLYRMSPEYRRHLHSIQLLETQGRTEEAIIELLLALNEFPNDPRLLSLALDLYVRTGKYRSASAVATRLVTLYPEEPRYHARRGAILFRLNEEEEALKSLRHALDLNPTHFAARYHMACLRAAEGSFDAVVDTLGFLSFADLVRLTAWLSDEYEMLIPLIHENGYRLMTMAVLTGGEIKSGDLKKFVAPVNADMLIYSPAGLAAEELVVTPVGQMFAEDTRQLRERLRNAHRLLTQMSRAVENEQWGEVSRIADSGQLVRTGLQSSTIRMFSAFGRLRMGDTEQALRSMQTIIDERPGASPLLHYAGSILLEEGLWQEAEIQLRESVKRFPDDSVLALLWAAVLARQGLQREAAGVLDGIRPRKTELPTLRGLIAQNPSYLEALSGTRAFQQWKETLH